MGQTCDGGRSFQRQKPVWGISGDYRSDTEFHFQTLRLENADSVSSFYETWLNGSRTVRVIIDFNHKEAEEHILTLKASQRDDLPKINLNK